MNNDAQAKTRSTVANIRRIVTLGALTLAGVHLAWPELAIDGVTLVLLVVAVLPWLAPVFKSLEFPGGWKIEFPELERAAKRADEAGLLAPHREAAVQEHTFQRIAEEDPTLALAGLRIEIERRLVAIAERSGFEVRNRGIGQVLRLLGDKQVLGVQERSVLADLIGLLNSAVHGAVVDPRSARWAMEVGPRLLTALDELGPKGD